MIIVSEAEGAVSPDISPTPKKYFGSKRDMAELKRNLETYLTTLDIFVTTLNDEKIKDKLTEERKSELCSELDSVRNWLEDTSKLRLGKAGGRNSKIDSAKNWLEDASKLRLSKAGGKNSEEMIQKRKKLEKLAKSVIAKVSVDGFVSLFYSQSRLFVTLFLPQPNLFNSAPVSIVIPRPKYPNP